MERHAVIFPLVEEVASEFWLRGTRNVVRVDVCLVSGRWTSTSCGVVIEWKMGSDSKAPTTMTGGSGRVERKQVHKGRVCVGQSYVYLGGCQYRGG